MNETTRTAPAADPSARATDPSPSRTPLLAVVALGAAAVLNAIGSFGDGAAEHGWGDFLAVLAISVVATAVVFGLVVRTAPRGDASRRALVLGVLAVLSVAVFWAGVTLPLALGAVACALVARDLHGRLAGAATAGTVLAGLATVAATLLAFTG